MRQGYRVPDPIRGLMRRVDFTSESDILGLAVLVFAWGLIVRWYIEDRRYRRAETERGPNGPDL